MIRWPNKIGGRTSAPLFRSTCDIWFGLVVAAVFLFTEPADGFQFSFKPAGTGPVVTAETYWSKTGVKPGGDIALALVLNIRKPYHINPSTAKGDFIPTKVEVIAAPVELHTSLPQYPEPNEILYGPTASEQRIKVFSERTVIYLQMAVTSSATPGDKNVDLNIGYQPCDETQCLLPTSLLVSAKLNVVAKEVEIAAANEALFAGMKSIKHTLNIAFFGWDFDFEPSNLWLLLLVAAVGGLMLNLTPCVLPLIPIKIIGLSKAAGNRQRCFLLGLTLSAGVVSFWIALAIAILTISGFGATNQLFQYPAFTITVGVIICGMAVGMCGLFAINLPQWAYRINPSQESIGGSFLFGIMTAVLSTPCTAPFMGAAAAWSATQAPLITLSTFAAIGGGMALPYLVLSGFPGLVNRMPRAGPASELIKQVMGLLMLAAGVYFLGTGAAGLLSKAPDPPTQAYWWVVAFFVTAAGFWLAWRTFQITRRPVNRSIFGAAGLLFILIGAMLALRFTERSPINWVYYTPERLAKARQERKVVVLEFTAAWCLNCHALEQGVLHDAQVVQALNSPQVAPIKIDITGNNPKGNEKLVELDRRSIPFLVVYSPTGERVFSSDAYTIDQVLTAIRKATGGASEAPQRN